MKLENLLAETAESGIIRVNIKPNSNRTEILECSGLDRTFKIAVAAPPVDNKANLALVKFLSNLLGKKVRIKSGHTSRRKAVQVLG